MEKKKLRQLVILTIGYWIVGLIVVLYFYFRLETSADLKQYFLILALCGLLFGLIPFYLRIWDWKLLLNKKKKQK